MLESVNQIFKDLRVPGWVKTLLHIPVLTLVASVPVLTAALAKAPSVGDWLIEPLVWTVSMSVCSVAILLALGMFVFEIRDWIRRRKNAAFWKQRQDQLKRRNSRRGEL